MPTSYNQITGQSLERLAALSDGIFAVAMTLLVLDLHVPASELIHSQGELWHTLAGAAPQLISYVLSFMTLGIFWNGQQAQLNAFTRSDRNLSWIHLAFLFAVSIMPFSTRLLAEFISYRSVLIAYWGNILLLGLLLFVSCVMPPGRGCCRRRLPTTGNVRWNAESWWRRAYMLSVRCSACSTPT